MTAIETLSEFMDRDCIAEIRECDPSQVPNDEQIAIRAKVWFEFAFPHLFAALQVAQKLSLKDLFELMDAFTTMNQLADEEKKVETANFATTRRKTNSDGKHSNGKVVNHREMTGQTRHWSETNTWAVVSLRFRKLFCCEVFPEHRPKSIQTRKEYKEERNYYPRGRKWS